MTPDVHFSNLPPGIKNIWGPGRLVLVIQLASTFRLVPEVLVLALRVSKHWFPVFLGVLLAAPPSTAWRPGGSAPLSCFPVAGAPAPALAGSGGHTLPSPSTTRGCGSRLLWFRFSFSSASADRAIGVAARQLAGAAC